MCVCKQHVCVKNSESRRLASRLRGMDATHVDVVFLGTVLEEENR